MFVAASIILHRLLLLLLTMNVYVRVNELTLLRNYTSNTTINGCHIYYTYCRGVYMCFYQFFGATSRKTPACLGSVDKPNGGKVEI